MYTNRVITETPVSYTHLDVYKRQRKECTRAETRGCLACAQNLVYAGVTGYFNF